MASPGRRMVFAGALPPGVSASLEGGAPCGPVVLGAGLLSQANRRQAVPRVPVRGP